MRVGLVLRAFGGPGGTEKYAADLAGFLGSRGVDVQVWCAAVGVESAPRGVRVRTVAVRGRGWAFERAWQAWSRELAREGCDVVQGFGRTVGHDVWRAGGGAHAAWLEASATSSFDRVRDRWSPRERWAVEADRRALADARVVICNSRMAAADLTRCCGVPETRIAVVRNGVDGTRFRADDALRRAARDAWRVPRGGRVALFLGTGFRRKGLRVAVDAFAQVAGPADRLVVIGRDSRAHLRLASARVRLGQRLVVHGPAVRPECWLPGADAVVLPTLYDAAANTTIEALSCGVPAITSKRDGSHEVVPVSEWVVADPRDAVSFAQALDHAWSAGPSLAKACREAVEDWTVARNGMTMMKIYEELLRG